MEILGKVAMFDEIGNRVSDFYDSIDTTSSEYFAIVSKKSGKTTLYNFMTAEGKVISKEWFLKVEPFKKDYEAVRVERIGGYKNLLNREGKLIISHNRYEVCTPLTGGIAIVQNIYGEQNIINSKGTLISKRWFYKVLSIKNGWIKVEIEEDKYNFINVEGKFLLKRAANFVAWKKFILAISGKRLTIIRDENAEIVYEMDNYYRIIQRNKGLKIMNLEMKVNFFNAETGQPIFEKWQIKIKTIMHTPYIAAFDEETNGDELGYDNWYIYDDKGNKLTEQGFIIINDMKTRGDYCIVWVWQEDEAISKWLNLKTLEVKDRLSMLEATECI